ncbi:MAG: hypothetical protein RLZ10_2164 [Bacteroidota bacterium]|jgi:hypothetical protein
MTIEDLIKNPELIDKLKIDSIDFRKKNDEFFEELGEIIEQHPIPRINQ